MHNGLQLSVLEDRLCSWSGLMSSKVRRQTHHAWHRNQSCRLSKLLWEHMCDCTFYADLQHCMDCYPASATAKAENIFALTAFLHHFNAALTKLQGACVNKILVCEVELQQGGKP